MKLQKISIIQIYGLLYEIGRLQSKEGVRNLIRNNLYKLEQRQESHAFLTQMSFAYSTSFRFNKVWQMENVWYRSVKGFHLPEFLE